MDKVSVGYVIGVTESEAGWGQSHDGYVLAGDKRLLEEWIEKNGLVLGGSESCYSRLDSDVAKMVVLTESGEKLLEGVRNDRPFFWVSSLAEYVKE